MRRLVLILFLLLVGFAAYLFYQRAYAPAPTISRAVAPRLSVQESPLELGNLARVLGAATSQALKSGQSLLNQATDGQAEPLINQTVEDLQSKIRDLPQEQYDKVKYEFCKDLL